MAITHRFSAQLLPKCFENFLKNAQKIYSIQIHDYTTLFNTVKALFLFCCDTDVSHDYCSDISNNGSYVTVVIDYETHHYIYEPNSPLPILFSYINTSLLNITTVHQKAHLLKQSTFKTPCPQKEMSSRVSINATGVPQRLASTGPKNSDEKARGTRDDIKDDLDLILPSYYDNSANFTSPITISEPSSTPIRWFGPDDNYPAQTADSAFHFGQLVSSPDQYASCPPPVRPDLAILSYEHPKLFYSWAWSPPRPSPHYGSPVSDAGPENSDRPLSPCDLSSPLTPTASVPRPVSQRWSQSKRRRRLLRGREPVWLGEIGRRR